MTDLRASGSATPWFLRRPLSATDRQRLRALPDQIRARIIGQDEAVEAATRPIIRCAAGMGDPNRPIATLLFPGPTGTGKTALAEALAEALFGPGGGILRLDMGEYAEKHNVARLFGSPPGYAASDEGGQLTNHLQTTPYSVILFDEIEKAHPDVYRPLLQLLDAGRITDGKGRTHRATGAIIILTSNAGTADLGAVIDDRAAMERAIVAALKRIFSPELLNRMDAIVTFRPLSPEDLGRIVRLQLAPVIERARREGIALEPTGALHEALVRDGYDPLNGARPLRRLIEREIADQLGDALNDEIYRSGDTVVVDHDGERYRLRRAGPGRPPTPPQSPPPDPSPPMETPQPARVSVPSAPPPPPPPPTVEPPPPASPPEATPLDVAPPMPARTPEEIAAGRLRMREAVERDARRREDERVERERWARQFGEVVAASGAPEREAREARRRAFRAAVDARGPPHLGRRGEQRACRR